MTDLEFLNNLISRVHNSQYRNFLSINYPECVRLLIISKDYEKLCDLIEGPLNWFKAGSVNYNYVNTADSLISKAMKKLNNEV